MDGYNSLMDAHDPLDDLDALDERERQAEEAFVAGGAPAADDAQGGERMHSFYDRLRGRIVRTLDRRGGGLGRGVADALLLVPDMFMLLVRLARDPEVPRGSRALIGGA